MAALVLLAVLVPTRKVVLLGVVLSHLAPPDAFSPAVLSSRRYELFGRPAQNSLDFGKPNFSVGQINLKTNNLDCNEILANDFSLMAPAPVEILALFDVSLASVASQVQIPLRSDQLDYGDNFVTSYIKNNNFAAPLYSCSTAKINLDDFEYFQSDSAQSVLDDYSVRTFEGQFSSYEFISEENSGETLKSGMLAILY